MDLRVDKHLIACLHSSENRGMSFAITAALGKSHNHSTLEPTANN